MSNENGIRKMQKTPMDNASHSININYSQVKPYHSYSKLSTGYTDNKASINCKIKINDEMIGLIRKAIIRGKREIRNKIFEKDDEKKHLKNINGLLKIVNKKSLDANDESIITQIFSALKATTDDDLGQDFLDLLDTLKLDNQWWVHS